MANAHYFATVGNISLAKSKIPCSAWTIYFVGETPTALRYVAARGASRSPEFLLLLSLRLANDCHFAVGALKFLVVPIGLLNIVVIALEQCDPRVEM